MEVRSVVSRILLFGLLTISSGCSESAPPVAGGRPIDHWLETAEHKDPNSRVKAIEKLGNIGDKSAEAIEAIVHALSDEDPRVRKVAIFAVVRNKSAWKMAIPQLEEMIDSDDSEEIRKLAIEAHENLTR